MTLQRTEDETRAALQTKTPDARPTAPDRFVAHAGSPSVVSEDEEFDLGGVADSRRVKNEVEHPPHYQSSKGIEAIQCIEAATEGLQGFEAYCTGNAMKYLFRWKKKGGLQDLEKCRWYLSRLIGNLE